MPYGHVLFVMRLSPRHPGYVMIVWAAASVEVMTASNIEDNIVMLSGLLDISHFVEDCMQNSLVAQRLILQITGPEPFSSPGCMQVYARQDKTCDSNRPNCSVDICRSLLCHC